MFKEFSKTFPTETPTTLLHFPSPKREKRTKNETRKNSLAKSAPFCDWTTKKLGTPVGKWLRSSVGTPDLVSSSIGPGQGSAIWDPGILDPGLCINQSQIPFFKNKSQSQIPELKILKINHKSQSQIPYFKYQSFV